MTTTGSLVFSTTECVVVCQKEKNSVSSEYHQPTRKQHFTCPSNSSGQETQSWIIDRHPPPLTCACGVLFSELVSGTTLIVGPNTQGMASSSSYQQQIHKKQIEQAQHDLRLQKLKLQAAELQCKSAQLNWDIFQFSSTTAPVKRKASSEDKDDDKFPTAPVKRKASSRDGEEDKLPTAPVKSSQQDEETATRQQSTTLKRQLAKQAVGWSPADLSRHLGINATALQRWRGQASDSHLVSIDTLAATNEKVVRFLKWLQTWHKQPVKEQARLKRRKVPAAVEDEEKEQPQPRARKRQKIQKKIQKGSPTAEEDDSQLENDDSHDDKSSSAATNKDRWVVVDASGVEYKPIPRKNCDGLGYKQRRCALESWLKAIKYPADDIQSMNTRDFLELARTKGCVVERRQAGPQQQGDVQQPASMPSGPLSDDEDVSDAANQLLAVSTP